MKAFLNGNPENYIFEKVYLLICKLTNLMERVKGNTHQCKIIWFNLIKSESRWAQDNKLGNVAIKFFDSLAQATNNLGKKKTY